MEAANGDEAIVTRLWRRLGSRAMAVTGDTTSAKDRLKRALVTEQGLKCSVCGVLVAHRRQLDLDRIQTDHNDYPSRGFGYVPGNVRLVCKQCHTQRHQLRRTDDAEELSVAHSKGALETVVNADDLVARFNRRIGKLAQDSSRHHVPGHLIVAMMTNHGGAVNAVRIMIERDDNPPAVGSLLMLGMPELTVEYVIAYESEWAPLFLGEFDAMQRRAREKLVNWGFKLPQRAVETAERISR